MFNGWDIALETVTYMLKSLEDQKIDSSFPVLEERPNW